MNIKERKEFRRGLAALVRSGEFTVRGVAEFYHVSSQTVRRACREFRVRRELWSKVGRPGKGKV